MIAANRLIRALPVVLALFSHAASGAAVRGLYGAEVPVASRTQADRVQAIGRALLEVLIKVTGRRNPQGSPPVADALANAGRYVQQFQYIGATPAGGEGQEEAQPLRLRARFEPRLVDALARDAGLPVWGPERPGVLAWLAVERNGSRALIGADDPSAVGATLQRAAARRGVPLELPLLDLEDHGKLRVTDVWGGFDDRVRAASRRYRPDVTLIGRLYPIPGKLWEAQWRLLLDGGVQEWTGRADEVELVVDEGAVEAIDRVAARFAGQQAPGGPARLTVVLDDVREFGDYARALNYLESLKVVTRVDVDRASGTTVTLGLTTRGGAEALRRVVALGQTLVEEPVADGLRFRVAR